MSVNFRGYAQKSTVESNIIKAPDSSSQILEEGRRYLKQWQSNFTDEQANREQVLAKFEENFKIQEQERETNAGLRRLYSNDFKEALTQNHDAKIAGAEKQRQEQNRKAKELSAFSSTLSKQLVDIAGAYVKDREAYGRHLSLRYDLSESDVKHLKTLDGNLRDYEGKNVEIINELRSKNASWDRINQIKRLSGFSMRGLRIGEAVRAGENWEAHLYSKYTEEVELPNGLPPASLAAAERQNNIALFDQILLKHENDYLASPGVSHIHHTLISEHMSEPIARVNGRIKTYMKQESLKEIKERDLEQSGQVIFAHIKKYGVPGFWDYVEVEGGKNNYAGSRASAMKSLTHLYSTGQLGWADLNAFGEYAITPRDGGEPIKFKERFKEQFQDLKVAAAQYSREQATINDADRQLRVSEDKREAEEARQTVIDNWHTYDDPVAVVTGLIRQANHNEEMQKTLLTLLPNSQQTNINDKLAEPHLYRLLNENKLTRNDVINQQMSAKKTNEWLKKADENDKNKPDKEMEKRITSTAKRTVEEILSRHGTEAKKVGSSSAAEYDIRSKLRQYYKQTFAETGNAQASIKMSENMLKDDVNNGEYDIVERKLVKKDGREIMLQEPHFKKFERVATRYPHAYSKFTQEDYRQNPNLVDEEGILDENALRTFVKDLQNNRFKKWPVGTEYVITKHLRRPNGTIMTPAELVMRQLDFYDIEAPEALLEIYNQANTAGGKIPPELQKFTTGTHITKNSVNAALIRSGLKPVEHSRPNDEMELVDSYGGPFDPNSLSKWSLQFYYDNASGGK